VRIGKYTSLANELGKMERKWSPQLQAWTYDAMPALNEWHRKRARMRALIVEAICDVLVIAACAAAVLAVAYVCGFFAEGFPR